MEQGQGTGRYGLRRYGAGKFNTMLDAYVYELSLAGCDDQTGDVESTGWYGLLRGFDVDGAFSDVAGTAQLTADEVRYLRQHRAGAIVSADSQGFVHVEYFTSTRALDTAWQECLDITSTADESDESEG